MEGNDFNTPNEQKTNEPNKSIASATTKRKWAKKHLETGKAGSMFKGLPLDRLLELQSALEKQIDDTRKAEKMDAIKEVEDLVNKLNDQYKLQLNLVNKESSF